MCAHWIHEYPFQGSSNSVVSFLTLWSGDTLHALHHGSVACDIAEVGFGVRQLLVFDFLIRPRGVGSPCTEAQDGKQGRKTVMDEGVTPSLLAMYNNLAGEYKLSKYYKIIDWLWRDLKDHLVPAPLQWAGASSPKPTWLKPHPAWPAAFGNFLILAHHADERNYS